MIPANLLKAVAKKLTEETLLNQIQWQREHQGREFYKTSRGSVAFVVRYHEARVQENTIQLSVQSHAGEEAGSLIAAEDDKESYELLSLLVFAIQLQEDSGHFGFIIDEIFQMLPEAERNQWARGPKS